MDHFTHGSISSSKDNIQIISSFLGKNWFVLYTAFQKDLSLIDTSNFHYAILQDLCSENTIKDKQLIFHLLTLLEHHCQLFKNSEILEQTIGSLINIYSSHDFSVEIQSKFIITCTVLFSCNLHLTESYTCLKKLAVQFFNILIHNSRKGELDPLANISNECLSQFEECSPGILGEYGLIPQIDSKNILINSLLIRNGYPLDFTSIQSWIKSLPYYSNNPHWLHRILYYIYEVKKTKIQLNISPLIFSKFKQIFIYSSQIYNFHFIFLLLNSFGLELFTTSEEISFLTRLISLTNHPLFPISSRLFVFEFVIPSFKNSQNYHLFNTNILSPFDGPDTLEKKLIILNNFTNVSDTDLIKGLVVIEESSLCFNIRATNSLYRLCYHFLNKRPSITNEIQNIIISMMFASPNNHISRSFELIKVIPSRTEKICATFADKLLRLYNFDSSISIKEYLIGVPLALKYSHVLSEECLVQLIECVRSQFREDKNLAKVLLDSCGSIIRCTQITSKLKEILNSTLKELISHKISVTISSWSQIYMIAINTLSNRENIERVFLDEEYNSDPNLIINCKNPFVIQKVNCKTEFDEKKTGYLLLSLKLCLGEDCEFDCVFCIKMYIICDKQEIREEINIPFLDGPKVVEAKLKPKKSKPLLLDIAFVFSDKTGRIYKTDFNQIEVTFRDLINEYDGDLKFSTDCYHTVFKLKRMDYSIYNFTNVSIIPNGIAELLFDSKTKCVKLKTNEPSLFKQFYKYFNDNEII